MPTYEATATADLSGYTTSVQQAIAVTKEYAAANEGLIGTVGRLGTRAIVGFNDAMGVQSKLLKTNVAEAANYQQALGGISAAARAMNKDVTEAQRTTRSVARNLTGSIGSATEVVGSIARSGITDTKGISAYAKSITELSAATGESGAKIVDDLRTMSRAFGQVPDASRITDMGDALVSVSSKFGASASGVSEFSKSIAPFAKQIGMGQTAVLGFSTAFSRMGEDGYRSANVFSKVLADIDVAVREGAPTLGVYADAMKMTYKQAEALAKSDPTEFVVRFTEALDKQGNAAVRTLEALGLEGVRTKKSLSALVAGGDLRQIIAEAAKSYGSGTTAKAAAEQLQGLNEEAAKFQESLRQVAANSGEPMLEVLTKITSASQAAASALASVTGSDAFQTLFGAVGAAAVGGGMLMKVLNTAATGAAIGQGVSMFGRAGGAVGTAREFMGRNARTMGLVGGGATALGMLSGNSMLSTLGTLGLTGALLGSDKALAGGRRALDFFAGDAVAMWNTPFTQWAKADRGREWRLNTPPTGWRSRLRPTEMDVATGAFRPTGSYDQFSEMRRYVNQLGPEDITDEEKRKVKAALRRVDPSGRYIAAAAVAEGLTELRRTGSISRGNIGALGDLADDTTLARGGLLARGRAIGRELPRTGAGLLTGFGVQATALLANPVALGVLGTAAVAGTAAYANKRSDELDTQMRSTRLAGAEKVAEAYGIMIPTFEGIAAAGDKLTGTFDQLASTISAQLPTTGGEKPVAGGGEAPIVRLSAGEYARIKAPENPSVELSYQNYRIGPQTVGRQRTTPAAVAELIANYGAQGTVRDPKEIAAAVSDLKAMGKDADEVNAVLDTWLKSTKDDTTTISTIVDAMAENNGLFGDAKGQEAMKNWASGAKAQGMSDKQVVAKITDVLGAKASTLSESDLAKVLDQVSKMTPGYTLPTFVTASGAQVGPTGIVKTATATPFQTGPVNMAVPGTPAPASEGTAEERNAAAARALRTSLGPMPSETLISLQAGFGAAEKFRPGSLLPQIMAAAAATTMAPGGAAPEERVLRPGTSPEAIAREPALVKTGEVLADAVRDFKEGSLVANRRNADIAVAALDTLNNGDMSKTMAAVRDMVMASPATSAAGQTAGAMMTEVRYQRGLQVAGASPYAGIQMRKADADAALAQASKALEVSGDSAEAQQEYISALEETKKVREDEITYMQSYLKSKRNFDRSMLREEQDYQTQREYMITDYNDSIEQSTETFYRQQRYAAQDYHTQMRDMAKDYRTQLARAERQYNTSRERALEDHAKALRRRAEDAAEGMYDPFSRITREQTWSGEGLLTNLKQQSEAFNKQIADLAKLRKAGVDQSVIDALNLNDPSKAQQLDRLLRDISGNADLVAQLNAQIAGRTRAGGQLFGATNDKEARREQEDFKTGLDRMAKDRKVWLADAEEDYAKARRRAARAYNRAMERAQEGFDASMRYMERSHDKALARMQAAHKRSRERAAQDFEATFEGITTDYEDLSAATTKALRGETPKWSSVISSGIKDMRSTFSKESGKLDEDIASELAKVVSKRYGADSKVLKSMLQLIAAIAGGSGTGGGGGGAETGASAPRWTGSNAGLLRPITEGKGYVGAAYGKRSVRGRPWSMGWHTGQDLVAPRGTPVHTSVAGVVTMAGWNTESAYGKTVKVRFGDRVMQYSHLDSTGVRFGQRVAKGDFIGRVGSTGTNSSGPHVHVELRTAGRGWPGNVRDPRPYMWQGGLVTRPVDARLGENVYPEAVIPLNHRGIDVLSQALRKAFDAGAFSLALGRGAPAQTAPVVYQVTEDHSVNLTGPIKVVSNDPDKILRVLENKARSQALRSGAVRR